VVAAKVLGLVLFLREMMRMRMMRRMTTTTMMIRRENTTRVRSERSEDLGQKMAMMRALSRSRRLQ
jgi:hypothetical protein